MLAGRWRFSFTQSHDRSGQRLRRRWSSFSKPMTRASPPTPLVDLLFAPRSPSLGVSCFGRVGCRNDQLRTFSPFQLSPADCLPPTSPVAAEVAAAVLAAAAVAAAPAPPAAPACVYLPPPAPSAVPPAPQPLRGVMGVAAAVAVAAHPPPAPHPA